MLRTSSTVSMSRSARFARSSGSIASTLRGGEEHLLYVFRAWELAFTYGLAPCLAISGEHDAIALDILIIASYKDTNALQNLTDLVKHLRSYATEICVAATNAASYMTSWKGFMNMFVQNSDSAVRALALQQATTNKNELDQYREKIEFEEKDNVVNAISDYVVFLSRLFKVDFNINYEVPKIEPVNKQN